MRTETHNREHFPLLDLPLCARRRRSDFRCSRDLFVDGPSAGDLGTFHLRARARVTFDEHQQTDPRIADAVVATSSFRMDTGTGPTRIGRYVDVVQYLKSVADVSGYISI